MAAADGSAVPSDGAADQPLPDLTNAVPDPEPVEVPAPPPEPDPEPEVPAEAKAEAAIAEGEPTNHRVTFRVRESELELQLPEKLKMSIMFRAGVLRDNDGQGASRLIQAVIGPEQFDDLMDMMDDNGLTVDDEEGMTAIGNLLNDSLASYGMGPGESQASPKP